MTVVRISDDALALACGADEVARAFEAAGCEVERVSSWGMHWLEPLVEIDGMGFGPLAAGDVASVLAGSSVKVIGRIADHPFIARQQRLTFSRAGSPRSGYGCARRWCCRRRSETAPALRRRRRWSG